MSIVQNALSNFMPHGESRYTTGTLGALNAEVVAAVDGDDSALVYVVGNSPVLTASFFGSTDGTNYFPIPATPFYGVGGTVPSFAQPLLLELYAAAVSVRVYQVRVATLVKLRVLASTYTSGNVVVSIRSDAAAALHRIGDLTLPCTLAVSATAAVSTAATATLPAVAGLRHYVQRIEIVRSATAALTASATPVVVTTTNLPGSLAFTLGQDAGGVGVDRVLFYDFGSEGLAASAVGTATTIVAPLYTGVIWRLNVFYRLGV